MQEMGFDSWVGMAGRNGRKKMATHSSILAWELPQTEELAGYRP